MSVWKPKVLVIGPGGEKGYCELGALDYLHYHTEVLSECDKFVGVSVGSIISLLYVVGYTPTQIISEMLGLKIDPSLSGLSVEDIVHEGGVFSHEVIRRKLKPLIEKKYGFVPSLKRLYNITGKTFGAVTYNKTKNKSEYMNHETYPDLDCITAVEMSCNLPGFFRRITVKDDEYRDGAICDPYPLKLFDDGQTNILGIWVSTLHNVKKTTNLKELLEESVSYIAVLINSIRELQKQSLSDKCKHIEVTTKHSSIISMNLHPDKIAMMILEGFEETKTFYSSIKDI
jgi:predicted acylesterase/phospholipase RssA